ncbi:MULTISPECIES: hypothetical protein [unclassified Empedobacter]|uniref:hypothetical protein n=1 Tax=unclassified Empedobacter TaxID=2643773 RepID=UPI0025BE6F20|nr:MULTISPECIES: hypothetical protein [unclassified Empedobacter]
MKVNFRACNIKKELFFGQDLDNLISNLDVVLRGKSLKNKCLQISEDPNEFDVINDFYSEVGVIKGSIMRLTSQNKILKFDDQIFELEKITTSEISVHEFSNNLLVKDIYYFLITDKYAIVTIDKGSSLMKFQNYINWLLKECSTTKYFINDRIICQENLDLSMNDVKKIRFIDPELSNEFSDGIDKNLIDSAKKKFIKLFDDTIDINRLKLEHYFDINLSLTPHKESSNIASLSSIFKVITNSDNVEIITKDGKKINGSKLKEETVLDIIGENGNLDENSVFLEFDNILQSIIENENN